MTSEEKQKAIDTLKISVPIHALTEEKFNDYIQTLNKIMDWLEQEPCEDAISRQELLEDLYKRDYTKFTHRDFVALVQYQDTVQQEPKTGRWIGHREHCENLGVMPSGLGAYEWCSNCDCGIDVREWHRNHYNYCPNCGARMVEQERSEKE